MPNQNGQLVRNFRAGQAWPVLVLEHALLAVPDVPYTERVPYVLMPGKVDTIDCSGTEAGVAACWHGMCDPTSTLLRLFCADLAFGVEPLRPGQSDVHSYFQSAPTLGDIRQVLLGTLVQQRVGNAPGQLTPVGQVAGNGRAAQERIAADNPAAGNPPAVAGATWWRLNPLEEEAAVAGS